MMNNKYIEAQVYSFELYSRRVGSGRRVKEAERVEWANFYSCHGLSDLVDRCNEAGNLHGHQNALKTR